MIHYHPPFLLRFVLTPTPTCPCTCFCTKGMEQNRAAILRARIPDIMVHWVQLAPLSLPPPHSETVFQLCAAV